MWWLKVRMSMVSTQTGGEMDMPALTNDVTTQLNLLLSDMIDLRGLTGDRKIRLDSLEQTMENSSLAVADMESVIDNLERELQTSEGELSDLSSLYNQLLAEQAKLDESGHQLYQKVSVQDEYLQEVKVADRHQDLELTRDRFLRDEMRDEFYKKEEELHIAHGRLDEQNVEFFQHFEDLKADVRRQRQEAQPLIQELDSCDRMTLTRINHFLQSDNISPGDVEKTEKLKNSIQYISRYRKVFDEVADLEFEVRNSDRALEFSQSQVKAKLAKMETLDKELSDTLGVFEECDRHYLKSAPRCVDLAQNQDIRQEMETACWSEDEEETVGGGEFLHVGGMGLHRCGKVTDIRVEVEGQEEEEEEASVEAVTEENRFEQHLENEDQQKETEGEETSRDREATEQQEYVKIDLKKALLEKAALAKARDSESASTSTMSRTGLAMEGVTATEKHMSSVAQRGNVSLSRNSTSSFVKPTHKTELRATGSSAMYNSGSTARKQKK